MESKEIAKADGNQVALSNDPMQVLADLARDPNVDVDKLERIISLAEKTNSINCQKEFEYHFGVMQKEFKPVYKGRSVQTSSGKKAYSYANIDDILEVYAPILTKHGFSYRWEEESAAEDLKRITCVISGYGHEKKSSIEVPIPQASSMTNAIQQRGSATSYGKRYSFCSAVGVIISDEDNDASGLSYEDGVSLGVEVLAIRQCKDLEELKGVWSTVNRPDLTIDDKKILVMERDRKRKEFAE